MKVKTNELIGHAEAMNNKALEMNYLNAQIKNAKYSLLSYTVMPDYIYRNINRLCDNIAEDIDHTKRAANTLRDVAADYEKTENALLGEGGSRVSWIDSSTIGRSPMKLYTYPPYTPRISLVDPLWNMRYLIGSYIYPSVIVPAYAILHRAYYYPVRRYIISGSYIVSVMSSYRRYLTYLNPFSYVYPLHYVIRPIMVISSFSIFGWTISWRIPMILRYYYQPLRRIRSWWMRVRLLRAMRYVNRYYAWW